MTTPQVYRLTIDTFNAQAERFDDIVGEVELIDSANVRSFDSDGTNIFWQESTRMTLGDDGEYYVDIVASTTLPNLHYEIVLSRTFTDGSIQNDSTTFEMPERDATLAELMAAEASAPASGGGRWINLSDTPSTIEAGKYVAGNSAGTSLEFVDAPSGGGTGTDESRVNQLIRATNLSELQGQVTDAQIPDAIMRDSEFTASAVRNLLGLTETEVSNLLVGQPISGRVLTFTLNDGTSQAITIPAAAGMASEDGVVTGGAFSADNTELELTVHASGTDSTITINVPEALRQGGQLIPLNTDGSLPDALMNLGKLVFSGNTFLHAISHGGASRSVVIKDWGPDRVVLSGEPAINTQENHFQGEFANAPPVANYDASDNLFDLGSSVWLFKQNQNDAVWHENNGPAGFQHGQFADNDAISRHVQSENDVGHIYVRGYGADRNVVIVTAFTAETQALGSWVHVGVTVDDVNAIVTDAIAELGLRDRGQADATARDYLKGDVTWDANEDVFLCISDATGVTASALNTHTQFVHLNFNYNETWRDFWVNGTTYPAGSVVRIANTTDTYLSLVEVDADPRTSDDWVQINSRVGVVNVIPASLDEDIVYLPEESRQGGTVRDFVFDPGTGGSDGTTFATTAYSVSAPQATVDSSITITAESQLTADEITRLGNAPYISDVENLGIIVYDRNEVAYIGWFDETELESFDYFIFDQYTLETTSNTRYRTFTVDDGRSIYVVDEPSWRGGNLFNDVIFDDNTRKVNFNAGWGEPSENRRYYQTGTIVTYEPGLYAWNGSEYERSSEPAEWAKVDNTDALPLAKIAGTYSSTGTYSAGSFVRDGNEFYIYTSTSQRNTNHNPGTFPQYWFRVSHGAGFVVVGSGNHRYKAGTFLLIDNDLYIATTNITTPRDSAYIIANAGDDQEFLLVNGDVAAADTVPSWAVSIETKIVPQANEDAISTPRIALRTTGLIHHLAFLDWTQNNLNLINHLPIGGHIGLRQGTATRILEVADTYDAGFNTYLVTNVNATGLLEAASGTDTELLLTASADGVADSLDLSLSGQVLTATIGLTIGDDLTDNVTLPTGGGGGSGDDAFDWATEGNTDRMPENKLPASVAVDLSGKADTNLGNVDPGTVSNSLIGEHSISTNKIEEGAITSQLLAPNAAGEGKVPIDDTLQFDAGEYGVNTQRVVQEVSEWVQHFASGDSNDTSGHSGKYQEYTSSNTHRRIGSVEYHFDPENDNDNKTYQVFVVELTGRNVDAVLGSSEVYSGNSLQHRFYFTDGVMINPNIRIGVGLHRTDGGNNEGLSVRFGTESQDSPRESYDDASSDFNFVGRFNHDRPTPSVGDTVGGTTANQIYGNPEIFYQIIHTHASFVGDGNVNAQHISSGSASADAALLADGSGNAAFRDVVVHGGNLVDNTIPTAKYGALSVTNSKIAEDTITESKLAPAVKSLLNDGGVTHIESGATYASSDNVIRVATTGTVRGGDGILFAVPSPFGTSATQAVSLAINGQANSEHPLRDRNGDALHEADLTVNSVYVAISDADSWDILILPDEGGSTVSVNDAGTEITIDGTVHTLATGGGSGGALDTLVFTRTDERILRSNLTEDSDGIAKVLIGSFTLDDLEENDLYEFVMGASVEQLNTNPQSSENVNIGLSSSGTNIRNAILGLDDNNAFQYSINSGKRSSHSTYHAQSADDVTIYVWFYYEDGDISSLATEYSIDANVYVYPVGSSGGGGTTYTAGDGIAISDDNVISALGGDGSLTLSPLADADKNFSQTIELGSAQTRDLFDSDITLPTGLGDGEVFILRVDSENGDIQIPLTKEYLEELVAVAPVTWATTSTNGIPVVLSIDATKNAYFYPLGQNRGFFLGRSNEDPYKLLWGLSHNNIEFSMQLVTVESNSTLSAGGQESPGNEGVAQLTADLVTVTLYKWVLTSDGKPADPAAHWRFDDEWDGTTPQSADGGGWYINRANALDEADNNPAFSEDTWTLWIASEQVRRRVVNEVYSYTDGGYSVIAAWDIQYSEDGTTWTGTEPDIYDYIRYRDEDTGEYGPIIPVGTNVGNNDWVAIRTNDLVYPAGSNVDFLQAAYDFSNIAELLFIAAGYRSVTIDGDAVGVNGPWHQFIVSRGGGWPVADISEGEENNDANDGSTFQFTYQTDTLGSGLVIWERGDNYVDPGNPPFLQNDGEPPTQLGGHFKIMSTNGDEEHVTGFRFFAFSHQFARTSMSIFARYI